MNEALALTRILYAIRSEFQAVLQEKTGWGRNEVLEAYDKAVSKALEKGASQ